MNNTKQYTRSNSTAAAAAAATTTSTTTVDSLASFKSRLKTHLFNQTFRPTRS